MRGSWIFVGAALVALGACSGTPTSPVEPGPSPGVPYDAGATSDGPSAADAGEEAGGADTTPPGRIEDLRATALGLDAMRLDWTATGDDGNAGTARSYEVRRASAPILSEADFAAATPVVPAPAPLAAGSAQSMSITGLPAGTTIHFAIRAYDEVPNRGPISNSASATTQPRAQLQISEVSVRNTAAEGFDFVELVALTPGHVGGIAVRQLGTTLHTFAPLVVQAGDRLVVHATGTMPAGAAQEDAAGNKSASTAAFASSNAYDVYSSTAGLVATDNVITIVEGTTVIDAIALSSRDGDAAAATMAAFAALRTANQWSFTATPADGVNDCATQREAVSVASADTACGGFDVGAGPGRSVNRFGTTDTGSKRDFYVAAQTPGEPNTPPSAPTVVSALATSATQAQVRFSQEIAAASVAAGAFTITGLSVSAATLSDVHVVTLTTTAQTEGASYPLTVASTVQSYQSVGVGSPNGATVCGYSPGAVLVVNEVAPNIPGGADLVELLVTRGGALNGITLRANQTAVSLGTLLATMPAICAVQDDLVVVHLTPPAGTSAPASETTTKTQYPVMTYGANYDGAWDVLGGNNGVTFTDTVLTVRSAGGTVLDAVAFTDASGATTQTFRDSLAFVQGLSLWMPSTCGGAACTDATTPTAEGIAVDWRAVGNSPTGDTARRATGASTHSMADWAVAPQSLGAPNP